MAIRLKTFPFKTIKLEKTKDESLSTNLLIKWWFIRQTMAWVYTYTTLWLKVLRNIENIVREEMDNYWANEVLMPALSPKDVWLKTWRWDSIDVFFHLPANENKEYWLNSTHEEIVTPFLGEFINSYKDSWYCVYQIQSKFRNEKRAKSWILRWREFLMKDAYSFHFENEDFVKYYEWIKDVYMKIFKRLWIGDDTYITMSDGWSFTDKYSHEFQTLLDIWEDDIYFCKDCWYSFNSEIIDKNIWFICKNCKSTKYTKQKASEIGNIFSLETKYSEAFNVKMTWADWETKYAIMWCYWIWISRLMWVIAEKFVSEKWIDWPENIAPADYYVIVLWEENLEFANKVVEKLEKVWKNVILDDRFGKNFWFGLKAWDCDLLWIPNRIVVSKKTLEKWWYELTKKWGESEIIKL